MEIKNIISVLIFVTYFFFLLSSRKSSLRKNYLLFVLACLPLVDLFILPVKLGGFKVFDFITYLTVPFVMFEPSAKKFSKSSLFLGIVVLYSVVLLSALSSEFVTKAVLSFVQFFCVFFYVGLLYSELKENRSFGNEVILLLKIGCVISLVFLGFQLYYGLDFAIYELNPNTSQHEIGIRYPSYFQDPQLYAQYLAMCSFLFFPFGKNKRLFFLNTTIFLAVVVAIFLTGARAAFSGLLVGLLVIFIFGNYRFKLAGIIFGLFGLFMINRFSDEFILFNRASNVNDTFAVRLAYWKDAFKIFLNHPFMGIGLGTYKDYVSIHAKNQVWVYLDRIEFMDHPESGYLKFLVEIGAFGFIILFSFLLVPLISAARVLSVYKVYDTKLLFIVASIISWMVSFVTVNSLGDLRIFIIVVSMLCVITVLMKNFNDEQRS